MKYAPFRSGVPDAKGAYFTRGSGHDEAARYTEDPNAYQRGLDRLERKLDTARTLVPAPEVSEDDGAEIGVIAYGSSHWAMVESRDQLRAKGVATGYLLLKALPFHVEVPRFLKKYRRVYVVEQNRDGQVAALLAAEFPELAPKLRSVLHYDGLPIDAATVTRDVLHQEGRAAETVAAR